MKNQKYQVATTWYCMYSAMENWFKFKQKWQGQTNYVKESNNDNMDQV